MELMHLDYLNPLLTHFEPVSLEEMNAVRLMNRIDTKYTTSIDLLLQSFFHCRKIIGFRK